MREGGRGERERERERERGGEEEKQLKMTIEPLAASLVIERVTLAGRQTLFSQVNNM